MYTFLGHLPSGKTHSLQVGLGVSRHFPCKCQGPAEPAGAVGAGLHFAGLQGLRLGCRPGFLWVFSWNVAGPCWFLCLKLYLLQEGSLFFKLYIYKNRSYTVYIKKSQDDRNMYECTK